MSIITFIVGMYIYLASVSAENWATYPPVPKTATYNGFADMVMADLPACAQECVKISTGNTPCPNWDTGCLCIMPQWSGSVANCIASNCQGKNVEVATSVALSVCSSVGANMWLMPASVSTVLQEAADKSGEFTSGTSFSAATLTSDGSTITGTSDTSSPLSSSSASSRLSSSSASSRLSSSSASSRLSSSSTSSRLSSSSTSSGEGALLSGGSQVSFWTALAQIVVVLNAM